MSMGTPPTRRAVVLAVTALCLAVAPVAFAGKRPGGGGGKPRGGGGGTISLVLLDSTDGLAHYGQRVTFNVSTTATDQPWVNLRCYQNGALVGEGWEGFFQGSLDDGVMGLSAPNWRGGAADCTARLTTPQWTELASTTFHVYP